MMWKKTLILVALLTLSGCETAAVVRSVAGEKVKNAADQALAVTVFSFCGQPYSSLVRNRGDYPNLAPSVKLLCGDL